MSLLDAQIGTKAYYTVRVLKKDPKKGFQYHWESARFLDNMGALAWSSAFPSNFTNERALYQWDGAHWRVVPGFGS